MILFSIFRYCIARYILTIRKTTLKTRASIFLKLCQFMLILIYLIMFTLIAFSVFQTLYYISPMLFGKVSCFIINKFFFGIALIKNYYMIFIVIIWYFLSIKAIADTSKQEYKYLNFVVTFLIKLPLNLSIFGFTLVYNTFKKYINKFGITSDSFVFAMLPIKKFRKEASFDNGDNITKPLLETIESATDLFTTKDELNKTKREEVFFSKLKVLHNSQHNGVKQFLNIDINSFNKQKNMSIFRKNSDVLPLNWEGKLYNLKNKQIMHDQKTESFIEDSTCFAQELYKDLSTKNNVPLVHHITDAYGKDLLSGKEQINATTSVVTAYDKTMYNTVQEGTILNKYIVEKGIKYTQVSRLPLRKNDGAVLINNKIEYKVNEPYSLPSYSDIKNIDMQVQIYEIKGPTLNNLEYILNTGIQHPELINEIKAVCKKQLLYYNLKLEFPLNFLVSIDRPNLTDKEKEIIIDYFTKIAKNYKRPNITPYLTFNSNQQEITPLTDSWIKTIMDALTNL